MDSDKLQLIHPDPAKKGTRMPVAKYEPVKASILRVLSRDPLTHTELCRAVEADFAEHSTPFEGNLLWHMEGVKLDLEARGIIRREGKAPQTYTVTK